MPNPVVHFEIGCRDKEKTKAFYADIFGWDITPAPQSLNINTNSDKGVQGHITSLGHEPHHYINIYIEVENIEDTLHKIEEKGGKTWVGPIDLPSGQKFAWFNDLDGNIVGMITPENK